MLKIILFVLENIWRRNNKNIIFILRAPYNERTNEKNNGDEKIQENQLDENWNKNTIVEEMS